MYNEYLLIKENGENSMHLFLNTEEELLNEIDKVNSSNRFLETQCDMVVCTLTKIVFAGKIKTEKMYCEVRNKLVNVWKSIFSHNIHP